MVILVTSCWRSSRLNCTSISVSATRRYRLKWMSRWPARSNRITWSSLTWHLGRRRRATRPRPAAAAPWPFRILSSRVALHAEQGDDFSHPCSTLRFAFRPGCPGWFLQDGSTLRLQLLLRARHGARLTFREYTVLGHRARDDQRELPAVILHLGFELHNPLLPRLQRSPVALQHSER